MNFWGNAPTRHAASAVATSASKQLLLLIIGMLLLSGCSVTQETHRLFELAKRTTHVEPHFYEYIKNERIAQREARLLAEQAWGEFAVTAPNASRDFENGFTEGFADYLYRGGTGDPPVIPPRGYWHLRFLNHFGKSTINEWYEGFRQGAANCKARGLREMWMVPTSLILEPDPPSNPSVPQVQEDMWSADSDRFEEMLDLEDPEDPPLPDGSDGDTSSEDDYAGEDSSPEDLDADDADDSDLMDIEPGDSSDEDEIDLMDLLRDPIGNRNRNGAGLIDLGDEDVPANPEAGGENPLRGEALDDPEDVVDDIDDLFNVPEGDAEMGIPDLDAPDDARVLPHQDGMLIRSISAPVQISAAERIQNQRENSVRQTSGQTDVTERVQGPSTTLAPPSNQLREAQTPRPPREEPMRLIAEAPKKKVAATRATPQKTVANSTKRSDTESKPGSRFPVGPIKRDFDDSLPPLPLEVADRPWQEAELIRWDPVAGIEATPESQDRPKFDEPTIRGLIGDEAIDSTTQWSAEMTRAAEIPLRVADARMRNSVPNSKAATSRTENRSASALRIRRQGSTQTIRTTAPQSTRNELPKVINRDQFERLNFGPSDKNPVQLRIRD